MTVNFRICRTFPRQHVVSIHKRYASGPIRGRFLWFKEGDKAAISKSFSENEVRSFARISGDTNPVHTDGEYAATTRFGQCVVHGVLINGLASAVMGTKLPGPGTIVISHSSEYPKPLFIGEEVVAEVEVKEVRSLLVKCAISCWVPERDEVVMRGTAMLLAPRSARRSVRSKDVEDAT